MVMKCARDCKEEYNEWIAVLGTRLINLDATTSTSQNGSDNIELQVLPAIRTSTTPTEQERAAPNPIRVPPPYSASPSLPLVKPPPSVNVVKLKDAWCSYIDARTVEWKILTTTACVFIAASPTIFQMPYASDDPITRSLAFFSVCRALSGLVYGPIFPIYFRTKRAKSVHSAMLWVEQQQLKHQNLGPRTGTEFLVSMEMDHVVTASHISDLVRCHLTSITIFAYIWRTGAVNDPSDSSSTDNGRPPMSIDLALVLRIAITSITVVDIGCIVWIWRVLKGYNNRIWKDDDGGDAFPMTPTPH
ncbi:hypothetical protein H0H92_010706 [Tricholoma furcatifolium]|nr:hypothetical protein H0H92_010706 [Tricholoma furcatifolium]